MKYIIVKKRLLLTTVILLVCIALLTAGIYSGGAYAVFYGQAIRRLPIYRVSKEEKAVALTFDAAYGSDKTQGIMKLLKEYGCDGTFFLVGFWVENNPEKTKEIYDNGFEVGTHSNTHAHMSKLSKAQCEEDLRQSMEKLKNITGEYPKLFRAPYGEYNNGVIEAAESLGLTTIQWDVDSLDWMDKTTVEITSRVLNRVKEGSIILFHNNADHILDVLPIVLERLKARGFKCVKLSGLIYAKDYTIDSKGEQHLKNA